MKRVHAPHRLWQESHPVRESHRRENYESAERARKSSRNPETWSMGEDEEERILERQAGCESQGAGSQSLPRGLSFNPGE